MDNEVKQFPEGFESIGRALIQSDKVVGAKGDTGEPVYIEVERIKLANMDIINNAITNAINALKDGVGGAYDTLKKIQTELELDDTQFSALVADISGKVDKVAGKGLSECDYTSLDRSKVIDYPSVSDDADTILAANGNGGGASFKTPAQLGLVGTNVQALTNSQKLQARKNIGSEIAANLTTDTSGKVLDAFQGYILDQKIKLKADKITLVAFQLTAPNAALFNTGDIYYNTASKKLFVNVQNAQAEWEEVAIKVNTIYAFSTYNYVANGGKLIKIEALSDINLNKLITYNQLDTTLEAGIYLLDDILSGQAAFTDLFCEDTYAGFVVHRTLRVEATTGAASMQYMTGNNGFEYSRIASSNGMGDWTLGIAAWVDENFVRASEVADISGKVDKVAGKGLSECDYTSLDRSKVIDYPSVSDDADTILAANGNGGGASFKTPAQLGLVGTNVQALTNSQKLQARKNIGSEIAANLTTDTSGKVLDAFQGYILDQKIKLKADKITLVAFQLTAPNAALFNTGDIYYNTASKKLFVNVQNAQAEWEEVAIKVNTIYAFSTYNYVANGGKLIKIEALSDINLNKLITYNQLDTTLEAGIYLLDDILSGQAAFTDLFCEDTYAGFVVHRTLRVEATTGAASMQYMTGNNGFEYSRIASSNGMGDWTLGIAAWVDENFVRASEVADMGVRYFIDNNGISRAFGDYVDVNGNIIYAVFSNSADSADISSGINYRFAWLFDVYGYANNANNANNAINAYEANAALMYGNSWLFDSLFSSNGYANNANNASYAEGTTINGSTWTFDYLFNGSGYAKNAVEAQYAGGNFSTTYIPQIYSGLQDNWKIYLEDPLTSEMRKISKADFIAWLAQ